MKVLLVNNFYWPESFGGAERSVQVLAEALAAQGASVTVACLADRPKTLEHNGVRIRALAPAVPRLPGPAGRVLWHLGPASGAVTRRLDGLIAEERPDIVHTNNLAGMGFGVWRAAARRNVPLVHTLRDYYALCARGTMFKAGTNCAAPCASCRAIGFGRRAASDCVPAVVGNSRFILDRHLELGWFAKARHREVIFGGYDSGAARRPPRTPGPLCLGFIGRIHPTKGLDRLLAGLGGVAGDWRLVVAGGRGTAHETALRQRFPDSRITWHEWADPAAFYAAVDVVVVPSLWHEPLPRTIYEAHHHGVPVVAASRGGIPEIVAEDRTGWLFDPDAVGELEALLERLCGRPEAPAELAPACLAAAGRFSPFTCAAGYLALYRSLVA